MINVTKFLTKSAYMFDPNNPDDGEFREECAIAAGLLLEYIGGDDPQDMEDPRALGGMVVAVAALAKLQGMDLHELLGAVMSAYRDTKVQTIDIEEEDDDESDEEGDDAGETRH